MKSITLFILFLFIVGCYTACEKNWTSFKSKCYRKFPGAKDQKKAMESCENNSAHLVKIESAEENDFLVKTFLSIPPGLSYAVAWIGLNDINKEGKFRWTDGTKPTYTNWAPDQPNNELGGQDCVVIGQGMFWLGGPKFDPGWLDWQCKFFKFKYLCEKPQK